MYHVYMQKMAADRLRFVFCFFFSSSCGVRELAINDVYVTKKRSEKLSESFSEICVTSLFFLSSFIL